MNNIKELRLKLGLTQIEFAKKINVTSKTVQNWEHGKAVPSIPTLTSIAEIFGANRNWLLTGEGDMFAKTIFESINEIQDFAKSMSFANQYKQLQQLADNIQDYLKIIKQEDGSIDPDDAELLDRIIAVLDSILKTTSKTLEHNERLSLLKAVYDDYKNTGLKPEENNRFLKLVI